MPPLEALFLAFEIEDQSRTNGAQVILKIRVGPFFQINLYVEAQYVELRKQSLMGRVSVTGSWSQLNHSSLQAVML